MAIDDSFHSLARMQIIFATGGLLCAAAAQALYPSPFDAISYTISGAFLAFVLFAGRELSRRTSRGVLLSLIAQAAQVVHLNLTGFGLLLLAGPYIELGVSRSVVLVAAGAGAVGYIAPAGLSTFLPGARLDFPIGFRLDTATPHPTIALGVNLVALVFAARLWRLWRTSNGPHQRPLGPAA